MPLLMLKDLPRYECLLEAAEQHPELEPSAIETFMNLLRTADLVFSEQRRFMERISLSQGRFTVLMLLNRCCEEGGVRTPAELAEQAGVTRATMTGLIDTLEKDGLVLREADPADRRALHVRLTPQGEAFVNGFLPDWFRQVAAIMAPLAEKERKQLVGVLQKLQASLSGVEIL